MDSCDALVPPSRAHILVVDAAVLSSPGTGGLAALKAKRPDLMVLAYVPPDKQMARRVFSLVRCGVDELVVAGIDDHPEQFHGVLRRAAIRTVARVIERWASPLPSSLSPLDLECTLGRMELIKRRLAWQPLWPDWGTLFAVPYRP
jgi:hypothetical protein